MTPSDPNSVATPAVLTTVRLGAPVATGTLTDDVGGTSVPDDGVPLAVAVLSMAAKAGPAWLANSASVSADTPSPRVSPTGLLREFREGLSVMKRLQNHVFSWLSCRL